MADEILEVVNKPESLEVRDSELLISIATNISIELYPASPVFRARSRAAATSKMFLYIGFLEDCIPQAISCCFTNKFTSVL